MMRKRTWVAMAAIGLLVAACTDATTSVKRPKIEIDPSATTVPIEEGAVSVGSNWSYTVTIRNTGDAALTLTALPTLTPTNCPDDAQALETFKLVADGTFPRDIAPYGSGEGDEVTLSVRYKRPADSPCARSAVLSIPSNDETRPSLDVTFRIEQGVPRVQAVPEVLDVGQVPGLQTAKRKLVLQNTGLGELVISRVDLTGIENDEGFAVTWPCVGTGDEPHKPDFTWESATCKNLVIAANGTMSIEVQYKNPLAEGKPVCAKAELVIYSNDPRFDAGKGQGLVVPLQSNCGGPCLKVTPNPVDFGPLVVPDAKTLAVDLDACGDTTVKVTGITLAEGSAPGISIKTDKLGPMTPDSPLVIDPTDDTEHQFQVTCAATDAQDDPITKKPIPLEGTLLIANDSALEPVVQVPVTCLPVKSQDVVCAMRIFMPDGKELEDEATILPAPNFDPDKIGLRLKDTSYSPNLVPIEKRLWEVNQPPGSQDTFQPTPQFKDPTFAPNVVGDYIFKLTVWDAKGVSSECQMTIHVKPPEGCHVELSWDTPEDLDPKDSKGTDLDLHVLHPYATGERLDPNGTPYGYFDLVWDTYWMNAHPTWDQPHANNPLYQPSLDRDDTDGWGPENFTYTYPELGKCYRVGVHFFNTWTDPSSGIGFGVSYPTVRVYIDSATPIYEKTMNKGLKFLQMWDVGRVCCTDGTFEEFNNPNGTSVVVPNYKDESMGQ